MTGRDAREIFNGGMEPWIIPLLLLGVAAAVGVASGVLADQTLRHRVPASRLLREALATARHRRDSQMASMLEQVKGDETQMLAELRHLMEQNQKAGRLNIAISVVSAVIGFVLGVAGNYTYDWLTG